MSWSFARWKQLGIQPASLASDAVFLRRAYLDTIGTLPTMPEAVEAVGEQRLARSDQPSANLGAGVPRGGGAALQQIRCHRRCWLIHDCQPVSLCRGLINSVRPS